MNGLHKLIKRAKFPPSPSESPKVKDSPGQKVKVIPGKATLNLGQKENTIKTKNIKQRVISIANRTKLFFSRSNVETQQSEQQIDVFNSRKSDIDQIKSRQVDVVNQLYNLRDKIEDDRRADHLTKQQLESLQDIMAEILMGVAESFEQVGHITRKKVLRMVGNKRGEPIVEAMIKTKTMNNHKPK